MKYKYISSLAVLILFFLTVQTSQAQKISASDSTGCAPFVGVKFFGVPGATSGINWDFGDGGSSGILNPTHTFSKPGNYTVSFMATGVPKQTIPIQVFGKPTPKFVTNDPKQGCMPLPIKFQDQSTGGGGSAIKKWSWTFGDGGVNVSNTPTPSYTYNTAGQFNVALIVTDANGCDSSLSLAKYITVSGRPTIVVTPASSVLSACVPPATFTFSATGTKSNSPSGTALTYIWNFGNGATSTVVAPPVVTYTAFGTYNVKFIVIDNVGCSDSISKQVVVNNPQASFSVADTVCKAVTFINNSVGGTPFWNYGDGTTGTANSHTYPAAGTYTVKLTANAGACKDDTSKIIVVEDVQAKFTSLPKYVCDLPASISFQDLSGTAATWNWTFSSTNAQFVVTPKTSTVKNPTVVISNKDTNQYSIYKEEYLNVTLDVATAHGCKSTLTLSRHDTINLPTARFMPDTTQGCVPLTVQFSDSSLSKEPIVKWEYIFGDGTSVSGTNPDPSHTYTAAGTYNAILVITNSKGCLDTSFSIKIDVGKIPTPDFSADKLNVCPGDTVKFTDLTPASDLIDTWHYSTDASFMMSACPGTANPYWVFGKTTGAQTVTLTVGSKGCYASVVKSNYITVKGPLADVNTASDCDSSMVYKFTGVLQDADYWTWNFGDGNILTNSTAPVVSHTYSVSGDFTVKLIAHSNSSGCPDYVDVATAHVRKLKASLLNPDTIFCSGASINFNASSSTDVNAQCSSGYNWIWGDGTGVTIQSATVASHTFAKPGIYDVKLIVKDINNCWDTLTRKVEASGVTSKFISDKITGCLPLAVNFTDQSTSDTTLSKWSWNFGDGTKLDTLQNPSHTFTLASTTTFVVTETVTNKLGCKASFSSVITISKPDSTFSASDVTLCAGDTVTFTPTTLTLTGYSWDFGDGSPLSASVKPKHTYSVSGSYAVKLTVTDQLGCTGTHTKANYISVQDIPKVGFVSSADTTLNANCYPLLVNYTDTSKANVFQSRTWDLGNGSTIIPNVSVGTTYQLPGTYTVSLSVTTTYGCKNSLTKSLKVNGPVGDFSLTPTVICKGSEVMFNVKDTAGVFTYNWDFGDGYDTTAVSPVKHKFNYHPPGGEAIVTLVYWSADSSCKKAVTHKVKIYTVKADFKRNKELTLTDTIHCIGIPDTLTNMSQSAHVWIWNFGDGNLSTDNNPIHTYTAAGTYSLQISIKDSIVGCVDTMVKKMIINPLPTVITKGGVACLGKSVNLFSTGGTSYVWTPVTGLSSSTIANPIATPSVSTSYTVLVTDANQCTNTAIAEVYIHQPPKQIVWDTTIVIGQTVTVKAVDQGSGYTYVWTPADSLTCPTCATQTLMPFIDKNFTVLVSDTGGCFSLNSFVTIKVLPVSSVDVPTAFTPNGDGVNDIVFVDGWGIKRLISFKIYNRWGQLLFESNDIKVGWDGKFNDIPQNIETYAYTAEVETFVDPKPIIKKGFIKIIK